MHAGLRPCPETLEVRAGRTRSWLDHQRQRRASIPRQPQHSPRGRRRGTAHRRSSRPRLLPRLGLCERVGPAQSRASRTWTRLSRNAIIDQAWFRAVYEAARAGGCLPSARQGRVGAGEARRVTLVRFFRADGTLDKEVEAAPGQRLLDVAWAAREPLEGACEGVMACSTCHVIVDEADFERLPTASEEEEDLLDLAAHATRTSRLACQILLTDELEELTVRIPPAVTNWMGR